MVLLGVQLFSLAYYALEQGALAEYNNRVVSPSSPPSEQVRLIVASLKDKPSDDNNSYFLFPFFRFLRPTPWQVIDRGGDCADRSRLVIALLRLRGIHASKWALYDAQGQSVHAVVQADVETGKMVVDPLFGLWFPKPQDGYYAIPELKQNPTILLSRLEELRRSKTRPGAARLEFYPSDEYVYSGARTINWSKSSPMRFCYSFLRRIMGAEVDELNRPVFVEEPPLMLLYGIALLEIVLGCAWLIAARRTRKAGIKSRAAGNFVSASDSVSLGNSLSQD
jgi:hypothetical protein